LLLPAVVITLAALVAEDPAPWAESLSPRLTSTLLLVFCSATALVIPLWLRIHAYRQSRRQRLSETDINRYLRLQQWVAGATSYGLPLACLLRVPTIPRYLITMLILYAAYYFFPSHRRLAVEKRILTAHKKR
jgi:hypothetical protein